MSDSLRPSGLQHARLPCPSPSPRVSSSLCPLSWWCYLTISSSAALFSFCLQKSNKVTLSSVQSLSHVWLFATPWIAHARPPCPSPTPGVYPNSHPSSRCCHPAISSFVLPFSSCPQSFPESGSFQMIMSTLRVRWPKYWSFSFNISPSNEHPALTSFRVDWLDLLAVQGTLKSLLQHHSSKPVYLINTFSSIVLYCDRFIILFIQIIHTWKTNTHTKIKKPFLIL